MIMVVQMEGEEESKLEGVGQKMKEADWRLRRVARTGCTKLHVDGRGIGMSAGGASKVSCIQGNR